MGIGRFILRLLGLSSKSKVRSGPASPSRRSGPRDASYSDNFLTVDSLNFMGQGRQSRNKRWVVGCMDRPPLSNPRPGHLDGRAVLVDYPADRVGALVTGLSRPMECAVSDEGIFVVDDSTWERGISGDVRVFDAAGRELFRRQYEANVYNLDISKCGRYVVVQTANSSHADGNLLEVLNVDGGAILFSTSPDTGWADSYAFAVSDDGSLKYLTVVHKTLGRFRYGPTGEFLDSESFRGARLEKGGPESRILGARAAMDAAGGNQQKIEEALLAVSGALQQLSSNAGDHQAVGLRVQGEALEALGRSTEALASYDAALALNPKIGVARKATALRKLLGQAQSSPD